MPVPGQTSQVTCDSTGRIVDFVIQEGKGDMKSRIIDVGSKWHPGLASLPIMVFDREGYSAEYFYRLINANQPFVTWDKNVDANKLSQIDDALFTENFTFNGKSYSVFEEDKGFMYVDSDKQQHPFNLRHIFIWNHSSNRRTCGLAYSAESYFSTEDATKAILSRWGASENTFKHILEKHPLHYQPGFKLTTSDSQDIANPEIKSNDKR